MSRSGTRDSQRGGAPRRAAVKRAAGARRTSSRRSRPAPALRSRSGSISGRYSTFGTTLRPIGAAVPEDPAGSPVVAAAAGGAAKVLEELRLDVDGRYALMTASGSIQVSGVRRLHWVARLTRRTATTFTGAIWYTAPAAVSFPYETLAIAVTGTSNASRRAAVTFSAPGLPDVVRTYAYRSPHFRNVTFEFDAVEGVSPVVGVDTAAHPNRPSSLPAESLTIESVYERAGFAVHRSGDTPIPLRGAGADARWSDAEMHDAMQAYWSRFANRAQWALWVLFATRHETGPSLGGIMFDDIGPNHRQGTAIFYDSFVGERPPDDPAADAFRDRMCLWTAVHEMGHACNLAHSWQKSLGTAWTPIADEPEARSFMNYPYRVAGGERAFFASFEYRFSNPELLFMRHAPESYVRMGAADWFDHHAFREVARDPHPPLRIELRVNRSRPVFEFLEPVVIEVKIENVSGEPQVLDENTVRYLDGITMAVKREGSPARQYLPYARYCSRPDPRTLAPGEAIYGSVFVSAGLNGIDVAEPGRYVLQAALHRECGDVVSAPLLLRIAPPLTRDEEVIAQDYLTDTVGRVLAFDGTRVLETANDTLREVAARLGDRRAARHARVALGVALATSHKVLALPDSVQQEQRPASALGTVVVEKRPDVEQARADLCAALTDDAAVAAETLGHIDYTAYANTLVDLLARVGARREATQVLGEVVKTLSARGVLKRVLDRLDERRARLGAAIAGGRT